MPDIVAMGEALIDFVPGQVDCPLSEVRDFTRNPGGAPANVAVGLARLGIDTGFMGKVGEDAFGQFLKQTLAENEVDISQLILTDKAMTTLAFVSLQSDGERDFAFYRNPGADTLYRYDEVDGDYLQDASVFHFGSISLISDPARTTTIKLVADAQKEGLLVSFDPNIRPPLWDSVADAVAEIRGMLPEVDVVKVNEEELATITDRREAAAGTIDEDFIAACRELYDMGPQVVAVTLGPNGAFYYTGENSGHVRGIDCRAIDTTGAGDGFVAGLLCKILEKGGSLEDISAGQWEEAFTFANKVGGITTTRNGGIPALPERDEL